MTKAPARKKPLVISLVAIIIFSACFVFYKVKKNQFLNHQLSGVVQKKTDSLYNVSYDSISVDELAGNLYIKNLHIKGDTLQQLHLISMADTNAASSIFDIFIPTVKVVSFKTAKALLSKQMECSQIIIYNPVAKIYLFPGQAQKKDYKKKQEEVYKQILGNLKLLKSDSVSIVNASVETIDFTTKEVKFKTLGTNIQLSKVAIDSTYNQDTTRTMFCKQISVKSDKIILGDKNNTAQILNAAFNTSSKIITLASFTYDAFKTGGFFKSRIEDISLEGFKWLGPVDNSNLTISKIIIGKGEVESEISNGKEDKSKSQKKTKILTGWIKKFSLQSLEVKSLDLVSRSKDTKDKPFVVKNNSFSLQNVSINQNSTLDETLIKQAGDIKFYNDNITIISGDKFYKYKVLGTRLDTKSKSLSFKSIKVEPTLNEAAFAKKMKVCKDRYDIDIEDIKCTNVDIAQLLKGKIDIEKVNTSGSSIKIFDDLSYPSDTLLRHGKQETYPIQIIHKLGLLVKINKIISNNTYIEYKEKNKTSQKSGKIKFSNSDIVVNNISTYKASPGEMMTINFKSTFLDKIPVTGKISFALTEWEKGTFTANARVNESVDATVLNQVTQPLSLLKIEKGMISSIDFEMKGDTNTSAAKLILPYKDLKISLLKMKGNEYATKGILSFVTNVGVRNNNKEGTNNRIANVTMPKNNSKLFFKFIWETLFKGIKDIAILKL